MQKLFLFLISLFCIASLCSCRETREEAVIQSKQDLLGKQVGVITGTFHDQLVLDSIGNVTLSYFQGVPEIILALQKGKIDAAMVEYVTAIRNNHKYPELKILDKVLPYVPQAIGIKKGNPLKQELDPIIEKFFEEKLYEKLINKWILNEDSDIPEQDWEGKNGTLIVGTTGVMPPNNFYHGDKLVGADVEFIYAIGKTLDKKIEFVTLDFNALMPALQSNKIDICIASIVITEERRKIIDFTKHYYESAIVALINQDSSASTPSSSDKKTPNYQTYADLDGKRIGIHSGSIFDQLLQGRIKNPQFHYLATTADLFQALDAGNIDAVGIDLPMAKPYLKIYSKTKVLDEIINEDSYGIAMPEGSPYKADVDAVIQQLRKTGELQRIVIKWENETEETTSEAPEISDANGDIDITFDGSNPPFDFFKNNKLVGINVDIAYAIGAALHKNVKLNTLPFASFISALGTHKTDMCLASISITEEREKLIDFSIPYFENMNVVIVKDNEEKKDDKQITSFKDLNWKKTGVVTGTMYDVMVADRIKNAEIKYFMNYTDVFNALVARKVDAVGIDKAVISFWTRNYPQVKVLDEKFSQDNYGIVLKKGDPLKRTLDSLLQILEDNGGLERIIDKWENETDDDFPIEQNWEGKNGTLTVALTGLFPPFDFYKEGKLAGIDIDLALTLGKMMDKKIIFSVNEFPMIIPSITSGKSDISIAGVSITEERENLVDFSIPYYKNEGSLVVRDESAFKEETQSFIQELKASFHRTFIQEERWKMVCNGLGITIIISILSGIFGTLFGFVICILRRSKYSSAIVPSAIFIRAIQGTPVLVLLMILYYIVFGHSSLSGITVAVIGFSINFGVYSAEIMRSGMDAVDRGQMEAAAALGYNRRQTFLKILLPQAANHFIPVLKGEFISMVKMTSIVGYIAVMDLTKVTDIIRSRTMEAFFPLIATAILYFIIASALTYILTLVEKKTDPKHRVRKVKGVD